MNGVERAKPQIKSVSLHQPFGRNKLRFTDGGNQELLSHDVILELPHQQAGVLLADESRPHLDRKDRREFNHRQPGNSDLGAGRLDNLVNFGCSDFRVIKLGKRA